MLLEPKKPEDRPYGADAVLPGNYVELRWKVRNMSNKDWPLRTELRSMLESDLQIASVPLHHIGLKTGRTHEIKVTVRLPEVKEVDGRRFECSFGLFNTGNDERFGELLRAFILAPQSKGGANDEAMEFEREAPAVGEPEKSGVEDQ